MISHEEHRRRLARDVGKTVHIVDRGEALCGNFKDGDLHQPIAMTGHTDAAVRRQVYAERRVVRELCPACIAKLKCKRLPRGMTVLGRWIRGC